MSDQQQHYRMIRLDIIKYLETITDPKKIISFLGQACITKIDEEDFCIIIGVPNEFILVQVKKFFGDILQQAVKEVYNPHYGAMIKVVSTLHDLHPVDLKKILQPSTPDLTTSVTKTISAP